MFRIILNLLVFATNTYGQPNSNPLVMPAHGLLKSSIHHDNKLTDGSFSFPESNESSSYQQQRFHTFSGPDRVGNGGDVIFCSDSSSEHHLTLLDTYELRRIGKTPHWGIGSDWKTLSKEVLFRWQNVAPERVEIYLGWLESFEDEALFGENVIGDIPDHGNIILPLGCEIRQVAMQRPDDSLFPGQARYEIDLTYWQYMSPRERAALVLHELILREAINQAHHLNSIPTRYLNGFLLSEEVNPNSYFRAFILAGFPYAELGFGAVVKNGEYSCAFGGCQWSSRVQVHPNGLPASKAEIIKLNGPLVFPSFQCDLGVEKEYHNYGYISFDAEGFLSLFQRGAIGNECSRDTDFFIFTKIRTDDRLWKLSVPTNKSVSIDLFRSTDEGFGFSGRISHETNLYVETEDARLVFPYFQIEPGIVAGPLPGFGWVPARKNGYYDLIFGDSEGSDSFIKTKDRLFSSPRRYKRVHCSGRAEPISILEDGDKGWRFDEATEGWVEWQGCDSARSH
jgi:hypothetical protein